MHSNSLAHQTSCSVAPRLLTTVGLQDTKVYTAMTVTGWDAPPHAAY